MSACSPATTAAPIEAGTPTSNPIADAGSRACSDERSLADEECGSLAWASSPTKSRKRSHHVTLSAATPKGGAVLYALGGFDTHSVELSNVDRIPVNADGTLGAAVVDAELPMGLGGFTGGIVSNVMVIAGGMASGKPTDASYTATIGEEGALSAWRRAGAVAHQRFHAGAFVADKSIYVLGGFDSAQVWDDVVKASVSSDGTLSAWTPAGKMMGPRSHFSVSIVDGYVFVTGGLEEREVSGPVPSLADVSRGRVAEDGSVGEWTKMSPMPVTLAAHASLFYGGYLYVAGGLSGGTKLIEEKRTWRAPIDKAHALGTWESVASLPRARAHVHQLPVIGHRVYSIGGALDLELKSSDAIDVGTFD